MKLVVIIPAYNEQETIAQVIKETPRKINGIKQVEIIVINDGSTDKTAEKAKQAGADEIINFKENRGLANAFKVGLEKAVEENADIIVNIDADLQYNPKEIPKLIQPILKQQTDIVLGNRQINNLKHKQFLLSQEEQHILEILYKE